MQEETLQDEILMNHWWPAAVQDKTLLLMACSSAGQNPTYHENFMEPVMVVSTLSGTPADRQTDRQTPQVGQQAGSSRIDECGVLFAGILSWELIP
jgi:hypothetical protein